MTGIDGDDMPRRPAGAPGFPPLSIRAQLRWSRVGPIVERLRPRRTIEVGVGSGTMGARIAALSESYVGVEIDARSAATAAANIRPHGGEVFNERLETGDREPADLVCAFEVLEHIEDDREALESWRDHVAPGGHMLLSVPSNPDRFGPMDDYAGHFRRYTVEQMTELMESVGLRVESIREYGAPLGYLLEAVRNRIDAKKLAQPHGEIEELTKASGRTFQFKRRSAFSAVSHAAVVPFVYAQRFYTKGIGLVVLARRPL